MGLVALLLAGCGTGDPTPTDEEETNLLLASSQVLPAGLVGEPYEASVRSEGGIPPITFTVAPESELPLGLSLLGDGAIIGVPYEAGRFTVQIIATDQLGQDQGFLASIEIGLEPELLTCGQTKTGTFTANAMLTSGPVWSSVGTENLQWLGIPWPQGDNQRIELDMEAETTVALFVQRPNQPLGSLNWRDHYVAAYVGSGSEVDVRLDPGTVPSLSTYAAQGIVPVLMVTFGPGDYALSVDCSDGPVFRAALPLPVRLGDEFAIDYEVYGDNSNVSFTFEGELPEWVAVDEASGTLSGTALEEVTIPLTLTAETSDGRSRTADSIFGVFDPKPIACDETVTVETEEHYYEGAINGYYDPRGFRVYELPVPADVSAVEWTLDGKPGQYLGLVEHDEEQYLYFGGADRAFSSTGPALLDVTPRTYPAIKHYREAGVMYMVAAPTDTGDPLTLTPACDRGPRPNQAGLPVIQPLAPVDELLRAIGGEPPYVFEADGLPQGLSVAGDRLTGNANVVGTYTVDLTVTDALDARFTDRYDLYLGLDEACEGGVRVGCGDALDETFEEFAGYEAGAAEVRLCFYEEDVAAVGFEFVSFDAELALDIADPGARGSRFLSTGQGTFAGTVIRDDAEAIALNVFSWPRLPDYDGLPVHIAVRAIDAGDWSVSVACDTKLP